MTTSCFVLLVGKRQQTDPRGEGKKENQHIKATYEYTKCINFGLKHKCFSNRIHSLG